MVSKKELPLLKEETSALIYSLKMVVSHYISRFRQKPLEFSNTLIKSVKFVLENLRNVTRFRDRSELFRQSIHKVDVDGLFLEFGVYKGSTVNYVASLMPDKIIYGFDSFKGLPEDWTDDYCQEKFGLDELPMVRNNVKLIVGLFQGSLEPFLTEHTEKVAFLHIDSDLYSSAKYVLFTLAKHNRLQRGTVIQFDKLFGYLGGLWRVKGEYEALLEFAEEFNVEFEYLGYVIFGQVSIRILKIRPHSLLLPLGDNMIE